MKEFVAAEIEPMDLVFRHPAAPFDPSSPAQRAMAPLKEIVKKKGLWACHLGPELGGQGFGQVKLGLMNERMIAVHMVHLTDDEIAMLAKNKVHIAHNASSNLKLASGIARVADLDAAGVNVALGTDGAASNNRQDMFEEIRQAALLAVRGAFTP